MVVDTQDAVNAIRSEWERVLDAIPADGDTNLLREDLKPKWAELPKVATRNLRRSEGIGPVSSELENPTVNPVTGFGRSSADVQRELAGHQGYIRRTTAGSGTQPIFQSDYLVVTLQPNPIQLVRVVNNCIMDEALSLHIEFTVVAYEHTPQRGYSGFIGTFTKLPNEAHDPSDRRKGGKFTRYANVSRKDVLVYNVNTWVDRHMVAENARVQGPPNDCLRIKPSSLRALAAVCSHMPMPPRLPPEYADVDDEEVEEREQREHVSDDPPAPIPEGFEPVNWSEGSEMTIKVFMIFTQLNKGGKSWHRAEVTKVLMPHQRSGYTHDARFADGIRGVRLTSDAYNSGCWIPISAVAAAPPPQFRRPSSGSAPAAASASAPKVASSSASLSRASASVSAPVPAHPTRPSTRQAMSQIATGGSASSAPRAASFSNPASKRRRR